MKLDERTLLSLVYEKQLERERERYWDDRFEQTLPRAIISQIGMKPKRGNYLLEKWATKDLFEYGTLTDGGWLTPEGKEWARKVVETCCEGIYE